MNCDRDAEFTVTLTNFLPYYIETYGYCSEHIPESDKERDRLKQSIRSGKEKSSKTHVVHKTREEFIDDFGNINE
jgi:hypothetical protein